ILTWLAFRRMLFGSSRSRSASRQVAQGERLAGVHQRRQQREAVLARLDAAAAVAGRLGGGSRGAVHGWAPRAADDRAPRAASRRSAISTKPPPPWCAAT